MPVVFIHGYVGECANLNERMNFYREANPDTYVVCHEYGVKDETIFLHETTELNTLCEKINSDPSIGEELSLYGESHGGHLAHYLIMSGCLTKKVRNFVSNSGTLRGWAWPAFLECHSFWNAFKNPDCYNYEIFDQFLCKTINKRVGMYEYKYKPGNYQ